MDSLDVKTKLEYDSVLFSKIYNLSKKTAIISALNMKDIFTVEDLINAKEADLPVSPTKRYIVIANILRYEYLKQELIYDVLLNKVYSNDIDGYCTLVSDMISLGLIREQEKNNALYFLFGQDLETNKRNNNCFKNRINSNFFTMINVLEDPENLFINEKYLKIYYINYIKIKNNNNKGQEDLSELIFLREQLQVLTSISDSLNQQIETLKKRISLYEGGNISHERK